MKKDVLWVFCAVVFIPTQLVFAFGGPSKLKIQMTHSRENPRIASQHAGAPERDLNPENPTRWANAPLVLEKCSGDGAYGYYRNFYSTLDDLMTVAKIAAKEIGEKASSEWDDRNLEEVKRLAIQEIQHYPIVDFNGIKFRFKISRGFEYYLERTEQFDHNGKELSPQEKLYHTNYVDPLVLAFENLDIQDGYIHLFKVVKRSQLPAIAARGLDSKYGGIGGFSEDDMPGYMRNDRGQNFMVANIEQAVAYNKPDHAILMIKIPVEKMLDNNLTATTPWLGEITSRGTISPDNLFIWNDPELRLDKLDSSRTIQKTKESWPAQVMEFFPLVSRRNQKKWLFHFDK